MSLSEAKAHLSTCLREVEQGGRVVITKHGRPVAGLVPVAELVQLERMSRCSSLPGSRRRSLAAWRASLPSELGVDPTVAVADVFEGHRGRGLDER